MSFARSFAWKMSLTRSFAWKMSFARSFSWKMSFARSFTWKISSARYFDWNVSLARFSHMNILLVRHFDCSFTHLLSFAYPLFILYKYIYSDKISIKLITLANFLNMWVGIIFSDLFFWMFKSLEILWHWLQAFCWAVKSLFMVT